MYCIQSMYGLVFFRKHLQMFFFLLNSSLQKQNAFVSFVKSIYKLCYHCQALNLVEMQNNNNNIYFFSIYSGKSNSEFWNRIIFAKREKFFRRKTYTRMLKYAFLQLHKSTKCKEVPFPDDFSVMVLFRPKSKVWETILRMFYLAVFE